MIKVRKLAAAAALAFGLGLPALAPAQVPPHQPGTVCLTPTFWCYWQYGGQVGERCYCQAQAGYYYGVIG